MQIIQCDDQTCKFNFDGYCRNQYPVIKVGADSNKDIINICTSYEVRTNGGNRK